MAEPNLFQTESITGEVNSVSSLTTTASYIAFNPESSNQLLKINSVVATNLDPVNVYDVTVELMRDNVSYAIAKTVGIPPRSSMVVVSREIGMYLQEGDALRAQSSSSTANLISINTSYEAVSSSANTVVRNGLALYLDAGDRNSYDSKENYVSYSNYNSSTWSLIPVTGTGMIVNDIDDPFGGSRAVRLIPNNDGIIVFRVTIPSFTPNGTDQYTVSFYVRAISGTGDVITGLADDSAMALTYTSSLVTDQWVRVTYTGTPSAVAKTWLDLYDNANTSRILDFYGAQIEKRSSATPLTETNGSVITTVSTTWRDLTSNVNNGTLTNGPSFNTVSSGSLQFTAASSQYVTFPDSASLTAANMSIEAWVRFSTTGTRIIYCGKGQGGGAADTEYWLERTAGNQFSIWFSNGTTGQNHLLASSSVSANVWYHVVATFDGSTMRGYVNGVQDPATFSLSGSIVNTSFAYSVGRLGTLASLYHNGFVAVNRIYNRALSGTEILRNYNAEKSRFGL